MFAVKLDLSGVHFAISAGVDFVTHQHNRNVGADAGHITVPVGDVLVGDACRDVKHDDGTLTFDVVPVTKTSKFFLARRVPDVETSGAVVCFKIDASDFDAERGSVKFAKVVGHNFFYPRCFPNSTVADEYQFPFRNNLCWWGRGSGCFCRARKI